LRPKQTAVVVTVLTGIAIAGTTLGILFASSKSLREGIFRLDEILKQLRVSQSELNDLAKEKRAVEGQLARVKKEQEIVQKQVQVISKNYVQARQSLKQVSQQAQKLRSDIQRLARERQELSKQKQQLNQQISSLLTQIEAQNRELQARERLILSQDRSLKQRQSQLQNLEQRFQSLERQRSQLQAEINNRDERIQTLDRAIASKDGSIKEKELKLGELEQKLGFLQREVSILEQYYQDYQDLRERRIAIVRGQVLAYAGVRISSQETVIPAVDELLRQANRTAIAATRPQGDLADERVVKITRAQVEQLIQQLKDGRDYVVRILSAGNYVQGEKEVRVFADATPNRRIFKQDDVISTVSIEPNSLNEEDIQKRIDILLAASQFRARSAGILGNIQIGDGRIKSLIDFVEQIGNAEEKPDVIQATAASDTDTIGPLLLRLVALKDGEVLFSTP
jgi:uncharacterized protein (DUF3084 family)